MEKGSLRKGDNKKPAQRHQNTTAYRHNKNSKKTKKILALPVSGLCTRCTEIIDWRKNFRKYKPLTAPKKCINCEQKSVKDAYHVICRGCAQKREVCAKCQTSYKEESSKELSEVISDMKEQLKQMSLPERQKRSLLRRLEKGETEVMQAELFRDVESNNEEDLSFSEDFESDLDV